MQFICLIIIYNKNNGLNFTPFMSVKILDNGKVIPGFPISGLHFAI